MKAVATAWLSDQMQDTEVILHKSILIDLVAKDENGGFLR